MASQDDIFRDYEGDSYHYRRLNSARSDENRLANDLPMKLIERNPIAFHSVAEVGAYNGFRLDFLAKKFGCTAMAFEPSEKALSFGKKKYPHITFHRNVAAALDAEDASFDLVIVDFVLHWIDRTTILRSLSEIDRILKDGGSMIIGDHWVRYPQRRRYHHLPKEEVWTFKQNYWEVFLATNCYQLLDYTTQKASAEDPVPRACALLQKQLIEGYPIVETD